MSDYIIVQDVDKCIGCYSCEIHCKANKKLPDGPRLCRIYQVGPQMVDKVPRMAFSFLTCFHCETPWCVSACPSNAMQKRPKDGIVFVEAEKCIGCKLCLYACPWGVPQFIQEECIATKCDLCKDRIDLGLQPACVTKCITGCLHFGKKELMPEEEVRQHELLSTP